MRTIVWAGVAVTVTGAAILGHAATLDGLFGNAFLALVGDDTVYAQGYSESAFRDIEIGESEAQVLATIGTPLSVANIQEGRDRVFQYSDRKCDSPFRIRSVRVTDGRVSEITTGIWYD